MTGKAIVLNTLENAMNNLITTVNFCCDTIYSCAENAMGTLKDIFCGCSTQFVGWAIWCGVLLLRSQVGNTPTRIEKRQVVRGGFHQEKLGRFESFPPHQLQYARDFNSEVQQSSNFIEDRLG